MRISFRKQVEPTPRPKNCLNCGVAVPPENIYCGQCGQENEASPVSFAALLREAWEEFIKVDKNLLLTLTSLLFRPGYLSAEYVRGRRAAYLSPFKMYITVSVLFFLVWGLIVPFDRVNDLEREAAQLEQSVKKEIANTKKKVGKKPEETQDITVTVNKQPSDPVAIWREFRSRPIQFLEIVSSGILYPIRLARIAIIR